MSICVYFLIYFLSSSVSCDCIMFICVDLYIAHHCFYFGFYPEYIGICVIYLSFCHIQSQYQPMNGF